MFKRLINLFFILLVTSLVACGDGDMTLSQNDGKTGGWSTTRMLRSGNYQLIPGLQVVFPKATAYTIDFSIDFAITNGDSPIFAKAIIIASCQGNNIKRIVNVANGESITLVCEAINITFQDDTTATTIAPNPYGKPSTVEYMVSANVSPGTRGANKQPPILIPARLDLVNSSPGVSGRSGNFNIPRNHTLYVPIDPTAGIISTYITVAGSGAAVPVGTVVVSELQGDPTLFTQIKVFDPLINIDWVPVAPGLSTIVIQNTNGAIDISVSITLGIDG